MVRKLVAGFTGSTIAIALIASTWVAQAGAAKATAAPVFDPNNFVAVVDNPYFPLPVGRTLVYSGVKDGQTQRDTVAVTNQTKVIHGVIATVVSDIADHNGTLLEKTSDWYAQGQAGQRLVSRRGYCPVPASPKDGHVRLVGGRGE